MKDFWNDRYKDEEYAYGTAPNAFFKDTLERYHAKGKILLPAEGEGRNAVYAAKTGLDVYAFDISEEGKNKAERLAKDNGVNINYEVGELMSLNIMEHQYDVLALIYAHFPPEVRTRYFAKLRELVKVNGLIIFEGFSKSHIEAQKKNPNVGGPKILEMLFSIEQIKEDFPDFEIVKLEEAEIDLHEGKYHNGIGRVIRFIGIKMT